MPREDRKRRYSDVLEDPYRGPPDFMEAGVRGFLVTTIPDREEHALDEAVKALRKACVKLYGGILPLKKESASFAKGYVMIDFMNPAKVKALPHPDAANLTEEEKKETETAQEEKEPDTMEEENKEPAEEAKTEEETPAKEETEEKAEGEGEEASKAQGEGEGEATAENKEDKEKEAAAKKEEAEARRKKRAEEKAKPPLMLAPNKFQSFRTELRNIMFIKSDVADPVEVATTVFDIILQRKNIYTDCLNQLLPVQGVCDNDYKELEIMCRRVLVPYVGEQLEEAPSFGIILVDKLCDPGSEVLPEVVRSAVWSLNPLAYQCSPWSEPDVTIHLEIIGSKIILSAMTQYMKYRQYSPFALFDMGTGKPQDENKILREMEAEKEREAAEKERRRLECLPKPKKKKQKDGDKKEGSEKNKTDKSEKKSDEAETTETAEAAVEGEGKEEEAAQEGTAMVEDVAEPAEEEPAASEEAAASVGEVEAEEETEPTPKKSSERKSSRKSKSKS